MHQRRVDVCKSWSKQACCPQSIAIVPRRFSRRSALRNFLCFCASPLSHSVMRYQLAALPMRYALRVGPFGQLRYVEGASLREGKRLQI